MKQFKEWREEASVDTDPSQLVERLEEIASGLEKELKGYKGDRFEGFLELMGNVRGLQLNLAGLKHQI